MPAPGDPKQAAWVCRMFGLEGTLFLEFLFFARDSEEWEVPLGVIVYLFFPIHCSVPSKTEVPGQEAFGESARTLKGPSFLVADKIPHPPPQYPRLVHPSDLTVYQRMCSGSSPELQQSLKIRLVTKFSLLIKVIEFSTLPLIQVQKY